MAREGGLVGSLCGLVDRLGLLGLEGNTTLALGGDTDGLVVDETGVLHISSALIHSSFLPPLTRSSPVVESLVSNWVVQSYLAGVHVGQVEGVARQLNTTGLLALDQVGVVVACRYRKLSMLDPSKDQIFSSQSVSILEQKHTDNLPDKVGGNVRKGGHLDGVIWKILTGKKSVIGSRRRSLSPTPWLVIFGHEYFRARNAD